MIDMEHSRKEDLVKDLCDFEKKQSRRSTVLLFTLVFAVSFGVLSIADNFNLKGQQSPPAVIAIYAIVMAFIPFILLYIFKVDVMEFIRTKQRRHLNELLSEIELEITEDMIFEYGEAYYLEDAYSIVMEYDKVKDVIFTVVDLDETGEEIDVHLSRTTSLKVAPNGYSGFLVYTSDSLENTWLSAYLKAKREDDIIIICTPLDKLEYFKEIHTKVKDI